MSTPESKINILATTQFLLSSFSSAERKAADYVLANPQEVSAISLQEFSKKSGCGQATIMRFCRTIGVSGYSEMKALLANQLSESPFIKEPISIEPDISMAEIVDNIFKINIITLKKTLEIAAIDSYEAACEAIFKAKRIVFLSLGDAILPCEFANIRFRRIGLTSFVDSDPDMQLINVCNLHKNDVAIAVSHTGNSRHVVEGIRIAKQLGAVTICITQIGKSELTKYCDIKLFNVTTDTTVGKEIIARRIAEQAILEALCMGVISRMRKTAEERMLNTAKGLRVNKIKSKIKSDLYEDKEK